MNEREFEAAGLMVDPENPNKGIVAPDKPSAEMGLPELEAIARQEYRLLVAAERLTVSRYWHLGQCLFLMREKVPHGEWQRYVAETLKMNQSKASRALRIVRAFDRVEDCQDMGLKEALDYMPRPKVPAAASRSSGAPKLKVVGGDTEPETYSEAELEAEYEDDELSEEIDEELDEPSEEGLSPIYELVAAVQCLQAADSELTRTDLDEAARSNLVEQISLVEELAMSIKARLSKPSLELV